MNSLDILLAFVYCSPVCTSGVGSISHLEGVRLPSLRAPMPSPRLLRTRRAYSIDRQLRRLGREDAACRWELGPFATSFLQMKAHRRLGFVRIGDYARERLGWSGRELQSVAATVASAARLPVARAAFAAGQISWSHLRLLTVAAAPESDEHWVTVARSRTVRDLAALVRATAATCADQTAVLHTRTGGATEGDAVVAAVLDECTGVERLGGEYVGRFALRCPAAVRSEWTCVVELARRVAGEQLSPWQAAELVAAEGLSASTATQHSIDPSPFGTRASIHTLSSHSIDDVGSRAVGVQRDVPPGVRDAQTVGALDSALHAVTSGRDHSTAPEVPMTIEPAELDRRMRATIRRTQRIDWRLGRLLRVCADCHTFRDLGYRSWSAYLAGRCEIGLRKARMLVMLDRHCAKVPALAVAYRRGDVSPLRALTILPVADAGSAPAWIERATIVTLRRLSAEVEWAMARRDRDARTGSSGSDTSLTPPPPDADLGDPTAWQMCALEADAACDSAVSFMAPGSVVALLWSAIGAFASDTERSWVGLARLLAHVRHEWERAPRHRDPVFARDQWRCAVPGCSKRSNLHDHHIRFRSRGGSNELSNRVTICAAHHLHGLHAGIIRATGTAPDAIVWELGVGRDGTPLLRLLGDRYVEGAATAAA